MIQISKRMKETSNTINAKLSSLKGFLAYARVATDAQESGCSSLQSQITRMEQYAHDAGLVIIEVLTEVAGGSSIRNQPVLNRVLDRVKNDPKITGILVTDFSRITRDPYSFFIVRKILLDHGVTMVTVNQEADSKKGVI